MKKIFALLALVLGVVSCQTEPEGLDVNVGGEQEVMLTVSLPETTRANSANGFDLSTLATTDYSLRYILEVYLGENCQRHVLVSDNTSVAFPVRLAPDRDYQLVVWADIVEGESKADRYYDTDSENGLKAVSIVESTWNAMDETRDAFTATKPVSAQDIASGAITMTLKRPFAKLRVVATDYEDVVKLGLKPATATVVYSQDMPRIYNALTGIASDAALKSHTINYPATPVYVDATGEYTLFADYFFVPETGTAKFQFNVYADAEGTNLIKATNFNTDIYVAANKLTTIKGDVLTTGANINIDIEGGMDAPAYEYNAIGNATAFYEALNNGGEYIVTSDLVIDQAYVPSAQLTATRTTGATAEGKVTTINLNDKTITVTNKTGAPFATVAAGNTLFLEGGNIVLTEGSNASFIENKGNVVLTSGELENKSGDNTAAVVEGKVIVEENATVTDDNTTKVEGATAWLTDVLANGGTYLFTEDMKAGQIKVTATAPVVLDGNGYTFTYTGSDRAIEIPRETTDANVTIKNLNIVLNASYCERGINFNVTGGTLTIDNVKVSETGTAATYAINLPGYSDNATVVINNSYLRGNIALNVWGKDMKITATDTEFVSYDNVEAENYAAISLNNDGATNIADGTVVTIEGGKIIALDENGEEADAISNLTNTGTVAVSGSTEVIGILSDPVAIVTYAGYDQFYSCTTLQQAINQAAKNSNATVKLIKDITLDEPVMVAENQTIVLDLNGKTISNPNDYAIENYGILTIDGNGNFEGLGNIRSHAGKVTINGGTFTGSSKWENGTYQHILKAVDTEVVINGGTFDATIKGMTNAMINVSENSVVTINGGTFKNVNGVIPQFAPYMFTYEKNGKLIINDGDFYGGWRFNGETATTDIYGGNFTVSYDGQSFHASSTHVLTIYGGTFSLNNGGKLNPTNYVAEGYAVIEKDNNAYTVIPTVLTDGYVLDLGDAEYDGTITVEGNVTIKGDTKIKTLKSNTGCTITIEDGKTLTLNNFSFGAKENAGAEYEIKGGTVTAGYGFFQHGKYTLRSNFETGYMYYSYGSDITVYGTFHSQGKGDGLDYVRGKLTIAKGGKSIHDKSLWVGQPASWGEMNASLVIEDGGYVQANSLSVYEGSSLTYSNDADLKYNSVTGTEYITKK